MKLEWFREHQSKFFLVTAIFVIPGMMIFGSFDPFDRGGGSGRGPDVDVSLYPSGKKIYVSPEEVIQFRSEDYHMNRGDRGKTSRIAINARLSYWQAQELGVDVGPLERREVTREAIKGISGEDRVTRKLHEKVLEELKVSKAAYERLNYEQAVLRKVANYYSGQVKVVDDDMYIEYCMSKQSARLWFKAVRSRDFEGDVEDPTKKEIKTYFDENKDKKSGQPGALYRKATLSVDILYGATKDADVSLEPDEAASKLFYKNNKLKLWKAKDWTKEKPTFKPYESVKKEIVKEYVEDELTAAHRTDMSYWKGTKLAEVREKVIKKYKKDRRMPKVRDLMTKHGKALDALIKKAEADKKPFGEKEIAAFAKENKLVYWRTKESTSSEYNKGKDELKAPDFKNVERMFFSGVVRSMNRAGATKPKTKKTHSFQLPDVFHRWKEDEGLTITRIASFDPDRKMTLEEASGDIKQRLVEEKAVVKAKEAAESMAEKWGEGKDIPAHKDLDDKVFTSGGVGLNALARKFLGSPKPLGEVLSPASEADPAFKSDVNSGRRQFLVGFAVERSVPTYKDFLQDPTSKRTQSNPWAGYQRQVAGMKELTTICKAIINKKIPDPPLFPR